MNASSIHTILVNIERAKNIEEVRRVVVRLTLALTQVNAELERTKTTGTRQAVLKFESKR